MTADGISKGRIITFYSYKGGTGRSMALANIACLLAKRVSTWSQRILLMDWDLEAPGLHRFFATQIEQPLNVDRPGVIDYFCALDKALKESKNLYRTITSRNDWELLEKTLPLN